MAVTVTLVACGGNGGTDEVDGVGVPAGDPAAEPANPEAAGLPGDAFEMSDGTTATLAELTGRPLVLNFFASWCPPCRAEMPDFEAVHGAVRDEVRFVGFAMQDTAGAARTLVEETGVSYDWALDPDGAVFAGFGGFSMPTTVYVSAEGEILGRDNGTIDAATLHERIERFFRVTAP